MAIKLIVSDLDGTLLNENHKISEVTVKAEAISNREAGKTIRILQEQGIGFELNTESGDYSTDTELCSTASVEPASSMALMAAR